MTTSSMLCQRFRCDLQGYVDHTLPSLLCITMILRVRRKFFEITTKPNNPFMENEVELWYMEVHLHRVKGVCPKTMGQYFFIKMDKNGCI